MDLRINGPKVEGREPLWSAEVDVVEWKENDGHFADHRPIHSLMLGRQPLKLNRDDVYVPGTAVALCLIKQVTVNLMGSFKWKRRDEADRLYAAHQALLLLQAPTGDEWKTGTAPGESLQFPIMTCIAGEIALDPLRPERPGWEDSFTNVLADPTRLSVHSGGLALEGHVGLPWDDGRLIRAPFLVSQPFNAQSSALQLRLDREQMQAEPRWDVAVEEFARAFRGLSGIFRQEAPGGKLAAKRAIWASLTLVNQTGIPDFYWEMTPGQSPPLHLASGETQLLVADQPLGEKEVAPLGLLAANPEVIIEQNGDQLVAHFDEGDRHLDKNSTDSQAVFYITAQPDRTWEERVELKTIRMAYDPLTTADRLRGQYQLPAPQASSQGVEPATLWGFMPLEDGWAQLPFLNLTEQIYFDVLHKRESAPLARRPLLSGAASFSNDSPGRRSAEGGEHPWSVSLLDGDRFEGEWQFKRASGVWEIKEARLTVYNPDVVLNGFLWLGTERPSAADALPSLDDWLAGAHMVSLRTADDAAPFPPPFVLLFQQVTFEKRQQSGGPGAFPLLTQWGFSYVANETLAVRKPEEKPAGEPDYSVFETLLLYGLFGLMFWRDFQAGGEGNEWIEGIKRRRKNFWNDLALVWRRHPSLPSIQALPLTQTLLPPSYPSPSRQLAPFQLPVKDGLKDDNVKLPNGWLFGVGQSPAAMTWPRLVDPTSAPPAAQWKTAEFLWMASLAIPGVVYDPNAESGLLNSAGFLPAQYHYGLPYTDEVNALAQAPKESKQNQAAAQDAPANEPVAALTRADFAAHWQELSEKALLARPDADEALFQNKTSTPVVPPAVKGLIEPFLWPVTATLDETAYPGVIRFDGNGGKLEMQGRSALQGLTGSFSVEPGGATLKLDNSTSAPFHVLAGSLAAYRDAARKLRDQRGLGRGATISRPTQGQPGKAFTVLETPLARAQDTEAASLFSLCQPVSLKADEKTAWLFWFRDVPANPATGIFSSKLSRSEKFAENINDPEASSTDYVHRSAFEWRLSPVAQAQLTLLGLNFYPLALNQVELTSTLSDVKAVELIGRLQLPFPNDVERPVRGNVVRVRFEGSGQQALRLAKVEAVDAGGNQVIGEWPLVGGDNPFAPSLRLYNITAGSDGGLSLTAGLQFYLMGTRWEMAGQTFGAGGTITFNPPSPPPGDQNVSIAAASLTLDRLLPRDLSVAMKFSWGDDDTALRAMAEATVSLIKNGQPVTPTDDRLPLEGCSAHLVHSFGGQEPARFPLQLGPAPSLTGAALQLEVSGLSASIDGLHLLPGMRLSDPKKEPLKGYAVMAFAITEQPQTAASRLEFRYGAVELIIPCEWQRALQAAEAPAAERPEQVFGSSAGHLYAGYTLASSTTASGTSWEITLLLNGYLEVKNLISWPAPPDPLPDDIRPVRFKPAKVKVADIIPKDETALERIVQFVESHPASRLILEGHADSQSSDRDNLTMSRRRARNVRQFIIDTLKAEWQKGGLSGRRLDEQVETVEKRLFAIGLGNTLPVASNTTEEGRTNNRRVEFLPAPALLPAANPPGPPPPLDHTRHTIRVLFNQHEVPAAILDKGSSSLLFKIKADRAWQFLAVVEHQLIDVKMAPTMRTENDRRWTVAQEVRLASPQKFSAFLSEFRGDVKTINPTNNQTAAVPLNRHDASAGYQHQAFLALLFSKRRAADELERMGDALMVEASAIHWIMPERKEGSFTNLQYLPQGTQRAILTVASDFAMIRGRSAGAESPVLLQAAWFLLSLPFLGRVQPAERDRTAQDINPEDSYLQVDPVHFIAKQRGGAVPLPKLPLALSSWEDTAPTLLEMSHFDLARYRRWRRLDPATLQENWFRLHHPPEEAVSTQPGTKLASIMAALPEDSPARLSRPVMLARLFSEYRAAFPPRDPQQGDAQPATAEPADQFEWRRAGLFTLQAFSNLNDKLRFYGFFFVGAQIHSVMRGAAEPPARYAAATLLPANLKVPGVAALDNAQPVSFAVSPYLGTDFKELGGPGDTAGQAGLLYFAELLCLTPEGQTLSVVASQVWQNGQPAGAGQVPIDEQIAWWGLGIAERLAADSPIAVLRIRKVLAEDTEVRVDYQFRTLTVKPLRALPARKTTPLRISLDRLYFTEGQFGGSQVPDSLQDFEVAPPQTRSVQPIYLNAITPPAGFDADGAEAVAKRQWGLHALRFSVQLSEEQTGVPGPLLKNEVYRLWWNALSHHVQFARSEAPPSPPGTQAPGREVRFLPRRFRARAIRSLLPAVPNLPLPRLRLNDNLLAGDAAGIAQWQAVLAGAFNYLIVGARPGAPITFRHFLLRQQSDGQKAGTALSSGAVPVQHRMPRPVALPTYEAILKALGQSHGDLPTDKDRELAAETAVQPWFSYFQPRQNCGVFNHPFDNAVVVSTPTGGSDDRLNLEIELVQPLNHILLPSAREPFQFSIKVQPLGSLSRWDLQLSLVAAGRQLPFARSEPQGQGEGPFSLKVGPKDANGDPEAEAESLRRFLSGLPHGAPVEMQVAVTLNPVGGAGVGGYIQTLSFPLRLAREDQAQLPLAPVYVQFEDPEYNRRLSSQTAAASATISYNSPDRPDAEDTVEITLAADRREYNPTSTALLVLFGDESILSDLPDTKDFRITVKRIDAASVAHTLRQGEPIAFKTIKALSLWEIAGPALIPGDTLVIALTGRVKGKPIEPPLEVSVDIVADPVVPAPESGYGLLRRSAASNVTECVRFAWVPQASRIELIDPADLMGGLVRRRAIFRWRDVQRSAPSAKHSAATTAAFAYAIQKIAASGATHFPLAAEKS